MEGVKVSATAHGTTVRVTRFDSHTQSSLMKRKEPKNHPSMKSREIYKRFEIGSVPARLSGVLKKYSGIARQNRNMQTLKTILKRERNQQESGSLQGELMETIVRESKLGARSLLALWDNLLDEDVARNEDREHAKIPAGSIVLPRESTETIRQRSEKRLENSQVSLQSDSSKDTVTGNLQQRNSRMDCTPCTHSFPQTESTKNCDSSKVHPITKMSRKIHWSNGEKSTESARELEVAHCKSKFKEAEKALSNEDCSITIQICRQSESANAMNRKCTQTAWMHGRINQKDDTNVVNRASNADLHDVRIAKFVRPKDVDAVASGNEMLVKGQKKRTSPKNVSTEQQACKPTNSSKVSWNAVFLKQLPPRFAGKFQASGKFHAFAKDRQQKTHSSMKSVKTCDSETTNESATKSRTRVSKENRDPRADRVTKICEHLAQTKQGRQQSGGPLPKKSTAKVCLPSGNPESKKNDLNASSKCNDVKPIKSRSSSQSRPQHRRKRSKTPKKCAKDRHDVDRCDESATTYKRRSSARSKHSEVMQALKEIINSTEEHDSMGESSVNILESKITYRETNDREILRADYNTSTRMSPDDEIDLAKIKNSDQAFGCFWRSIDTQTDFNSFLENEENLDSMKILKATRTLGTQTSPRSKNMVEVGCGTMSYDSFCQDAEVSCDLIGPMNLKADINESEKILSSTVSNAEVDLKLKDRVDTETVATSFKVTGATCDFTMEAKKITHERICQDEISLNRDDWTKTNKHMDSVMCFNNVKTDDLMNELSAEKSDIISSIYDYDASCSDSSEEIEERIQNDIQYKDTVALELKVKSLPSDVIMAFQLAAERMRNIHKAILLYNSIISKEFERRDEEAADNRELSTICKDLCHIQQPTSLVSCTNEDLTEPECNTKFYNIMDNENFYDLSTHSSSSCIFDRGYEVERTTEALALAATQETLITSREVMLSLIYCILCTVVYWCLQFSFKCDPAV